MTSTRWIHSRSPSARRAAVVASVTVIGLLAAACSSAPSSARGADPASAAAATSSPSVPSAILATYDVGGDGWALAVTEGHVWVQVDPPVDAIVRVDKSTGDSTPMVPEGWRPTVGPEGLWVASGDWVVKVDPSTGRQSRRVSPGGAFTLAEGSGWLLAAGGAVSKVDLKSGRARKVVTVDSESCAVKDIAKAFGDIWLACKEGHVMRVPLDGGTPAVITTDAGSHTFAVTDGAVWVTNYLAGSISRIDPVTNEATTIDGIGSSVGITAGGGYVWSGDSMGIARIDPETAEIVGHLAVPPGSYYEVVWDDGVIWASTRGPEVLKIDATP